MSGETDTEARKRLAATGADPEAIEDAIAHPWAPDRGRPTTRSIPELLEVTEKIIERRKRLGRISGFEEPSDFLLEAVTALLRAECERTEKSKQL